jgi:hypothetical protein
MEEINMPKNKSKSDRQIIKENGYDLIALTIYEGGEPIKYTKSDKVLDTWLKQDENHSWFGVNY